MVLARDLQLVIVTPERTLLDERVRSVRVPLFDGQIGILPGRAPLIGRLGYGELKMTTESGEERSFFIDGGFVQVNGSTVSILTGRSMPADQLDTEESAKLLADALAHPARGESESAAKERNVQRSRQMLALARKKG